MGKRIAVISTVSLILIIILSAWAMPFRNRVNIHGGRFQTKAMSLWELHQYKDTELLRKYPLKWCPFKAYQVVCENVKVENRDNKNWLVIEKDLYALTIKDAVYNKQHAKKYKGTPKQKVKKIYRYCARTEYKIHVKYAKDVFSKRQGDCAGIASAFYVLCKKNHIPVRYVIGWAENECHAWNRVKLNGKWYWIDATLGCWLSREQYAARTVMEMW